jgi:hypothetical protein
MNPSFFPSLRRTFAAVVVSLCFSPLAALAMQIQVELPGGGILDLTVEPTDTVDSVKEQIQASEGHLTFLQTLTLNSVELENGFLLSDYSVQDGDLLVLTVDDPFGFGLDFTAFITIGQEFFLLSNEVLEFQNRMARNGSMRFYRRGLARITRRLDTITGLLASLGLPETETLAYRRAVLDLLRELRPGKASPKPTRPGPPKKVPRIPTPPRLAFGTIP